MKRDTNEIAAVEQVVSDVKMKLLELGELQLALVGGGTGEVVIA